MNEFTEANESRQGSRWSTIMWSAAGLLLLTPLIAMRFTNEVNWSASDFLIAGALLASVGGAFELAVRTTANTAYRAALGVALAAAFMLVWFNGAVGLIGDEGNPANLMYHGVLAVGMVGAVTARFKPGGMAWALFGMALAQGLVTATAWLTGAIPPGNGPAEVVGINFFFILLYVVSALLFRRAARERAEAP